jgi:chromosome partitioning protein
MIIAVANHKGGSGKSTTAAAMAAGLTAKKRRVLLIDMDTQGNTTETVTNKPTAEDATIYEVLINSAPIMKAIRNAGSFGDIVPASPLLATAERALTETGREYRLKKALARVQSKYDIVIIDTPPNLGVLTTNALTAATGVIIPTVPDKYGFRGVLSLGEIIDAVREYTNPALKVHGILLTNYTENRVILREYANSAPEFASKLGTRVYKTFIRNCTAVREAQAMGKSIFEYAPKSIAAADYEAFIKEFIKTAKGGCRNE